VTQDPARKAARIRNPEILGERREIEMCGIMTLSFGCAEMEIIQEGNLKGQGNLDPTLQTGKLLARVPARGGYPFAFNSS
jgi:hypothetical protein